METCVNLPFQGYRCGPLGIRHEDHRTHRGDGAAENALEDSVGYLALHSPIVGIDDEDAGLRDLVMLKPGMTRHVRIEPRLRHRRRVELVERRG
jgi:hypothetical protein